MRKGDGLPLSNRSRKLFRKERDAHLVPKSRAVLSSRLNPFSVIDDYHLKGPVSYRMKIVFKRKGMSTFFPNFRKIESVVC